MGCSELHLFPLKISRLESASPNTAPRQCPTCKGPVGFAETNSTLYFFFRFLLDPYVAFNRIILVKYFFQKEIVVQLCFIHSVIAITKSKILIVKISRINYIAEY